MARTFSLEHRQKLSLAKIGKPIPHLHNSTVYKKISNSLIGKKYPTNTKEKHHSWKGNNASYFAIHAWLIREFGNASKCENIKCVYPRKNSNNVILLKANRYEWSLLHGYDYEHKRENYWQLCASCHRKYDKK